MTMSRPKNDSKRHVCIVNVGLFRSGTTTLCEAAKSLGLNSYREFPDLEKDQLHAFLHKPEEAVLNWFAKDGLSEIIRLASSYDIICDGWIALLPFVQSDALHRLKQEARSSGVHIEYVASTRDVESTVRSELQHWTVHDLESRAGLDATERARLEHSLRERAEKHQRAVQRLQGSGEVRRLLLDNNMKCKWSKTLSLVSGITEEDWSSALRRTGKQNANPPLPIEGILLTLRFGEGQESLEKIGSIERLLGQIEQDSLCRYLVVLGIDTDEEGTEGALTLIRRLETRATMGQQLLSFHLIINEPRSSDEPFAICSVWDKMATVAWTNDADWVVLLGDDVDVQCPFHYRAFYRSFLDISTRLKVPFGFGCPWWNDVTFPGFPSFPCVGKAHFAIYGGLIPEHRRSNFVNQDLDPYLQRLYLKFMAAPCVHEARLSNGCGGNIDIGSTSEARYERIESAGWRDFIANDIEPIQTFLPPGTTEAIVLDVVIPSYRVRLDYLRSICFLKVPAYMQTLFIVIIDNPDALLREAAAITRTKVDADSMTLNESERILEGYLSKSGNHIRVRCNTENLGASASRNRGLDESAAEFVLNLDDDLIPNPDLLDQYGSKLQGINDDDDDDDVIGLIGLVRFPRDPKLPLVHAAVLMSYLTFMFEIAERSDMYEPAAPAWGVTANILFRRTSVRFDLAYAKTGGGEDVDFSLRQAEASHGGTGKLVAVPEACVVHPFWPGSVFTLSRHFFHWAIGDGSLFKRFPKYRYWSFPNIPETLLLLLFFLCPLSLWFGFDFDPWAPLKLVPAFMAADFMVDVADRAEYRNRCLQLQKDLDLDLSPITTTDTDTERSQMFYVAAHFLGNAYVIVLECGRLWGHLLRMEPWHGVCQRFDWHCGRLKNAPTNFRQREGCKFALFVGIISAYLYGFGRHCH